MLLQQDKIIDKIGLLPAATKLGQGNIFTSVCQEFCPQGGGGGSASVHAGMHPSGTRPDPPGTRPPRPGTPGPDTPSGPYQIHPGSRHPPDPPWTRHPLPQSRPPHPPPGSRHLRTRHPPPPGSRLQHTVNERPVRILLECILVPNMFNET